MTALGGNRRFSGIDEIDFDLLFANHSATRAIENNAPADPVWERIPLKSKSSENQPLTDATSLKNVIASKS